MLRYFKIFILFNSLFLLSLSIEAASFKIGVLAFRSKPQTLTQWQPLAIALNQALPQHHFEVVALTYPELDVAVASYAVDFVLTNPGHYVLLAQQNHLQPPLATLAESVQGKPLSSFGGVIFCRAQDETIKTLADLKHKRVAAVSTESLGGYQMQAFELQQIGIDLAEEVVLKATGMPHDKVVSAVLNGEADAGFVRTGVLERMAQAEHFDLARLRVINPQIQLHFPLSISTRLYPEWPMAAQAGVDANVALQLAVVLFQLKQHPEVTQAIGIDGFVLPADYRGVEQILRVLRLPPFDRERQVSAEWGRYVLYICLSLVLLALIIYLLFSFKIKSLKLREDADLFHGLFEQSTFLAGVLDEQFRLLKVNEVALRVISATEKDVLGKFFPHTPWWTNDEQRQQLIDVLQRAKVGETNGFQASHFDAQGNEISVLFNAMPIRVGNKLCLAVIGVDISAYVTQ